MTLPFNPQPKVRTPLRLEQLAKRRLRIANERREKDHALLRDNRKCRVPGCTYQKQGIQVHAAHLQPKKMGGSRSDYIHGRQNILCLCSVHHNMPGMKTIHSGDLRIEPLTEVGTDGPCIFRQTDEQKGWIELGIG